MKQIDHKMNTNLRLFEQNDDAYSVYDAAGEPVAVFRELEQAMEYLWTVVCNREETVRLIRSSRIRGQQLVAMVGLSILREVRDNHPEVWDNLMSSEACILIGELWDFLRAKAK